MYQISRKMRGLNEIAKEKVSMDKAWFLKENEVYSVGDNDWMRGHAEDNTFINNFASQGTFDVGDQNRIFLKTKGVNINKRDKRKKSNFAYIYIY